MFKVLDNLINGVLVEVIQGVLYFLGGIIGIPYVIDAISTYLRKDPPIKKYIITPLKKAFYKRFEDVVIQTSTRFSFKNTIDVDNLKSVIDQYLDNFDVSHHIWDGESLKTILKKDEFNHELKLSIESDYDGKKAQHIYVYVKTEFRLGCTKDYLISTKDILNNLALELSNKLSNPISIPNSEIILECKNKELHLPHTLRKEGFKLSIISETLEGISIELREKNIIFHSSGINVGPKLVNIIEGLLLDRYILHE